MEPLVLAACRGSPWEAVRVTRISRSSIRTGYGYYGGIACAIEPPGAGWRKGAGLSLKEVFP
jgi:hypothetical protein